MPIEPGVVQKTALLARLELTPAELASYEKQLGAILDYVSQLQALDVTAIEPLVHAGDASNVFRTDEPRPSISSDAALQNAPERSGPFFIVPKVVE